MDYITFTLRLQEEIYDKIKMFSEEDRRSLNSEINFILEKYAEERNNKNEKEKRP